MRKLLLALFIGAMGCTAHAQQSFTYKVISGQTPRLSVSQLQPDPNDWLPVLQQVERPKPGMGNHIQAIKDSLDRLRRKQVKVYKKASDPAMITPELVNGFNGAGTFGTPNDNNIAVSNGGMVISVLNTNIRVTNDTGKFLLGRSLGNFPQGLGSLMDSYDPKVVYDPEADRFIIVFLNGRTSGDTRIIVCFSDSNDPLGTWNSYALPGNNLNDTSWTDYPIIGLNKQDFFITGNLLRDNSGWKEGFKQSVIWQIDKWKGYNGEPLVHNFYHDIRYQGKSVWNICAIPGGTGLTDASMHFLSVRPADASNDTVFLHHLTGSVAGGNNQLSLQMLRTDKPYGIPTSAFQPDGRFLETNDARVLSGFVEDNRIQYVQTTRDMTTLSPAVYHGFIDISGSTPVVTGKVITTDTLDFGYPSIACAARNSGERSSMITFSHVSTQTLPGTSVIYYHGDGTYSNLLRIKSGLNTIDVLPDSAERWGDYTGIQRKYDEPGVFWLSGSYGDFNKRSSTWISRVRNVSEPYVEAGFEPVIYPNPGNGHQLSLRFSLDAAGPVEIRVVDMLGQEIQHFSYSWVKAGSHELTLYPQNLSLGTYVIDVRKQGGEKLFTKKFVVDRE